MKKTLIPVMLGALILTSVAVFDSANPDFFPANVNSKTTVKTTAKTTAKKTAKSKAITTKQLEGVWKVEENYLMNKDTGKFELIPKIDDWNENYDQYYFFDGSNVCPSGGISQGGSKKYSCDGIGWLKYELKGDNFTIRKDLLYPGSNAEKWQLKSVKKDQLEMFIDDGEVQMRRIVKKVTAKKDFMKASEIKSVPVPKFR